MSYDLIVFDPEAAPTARREFMDWFEAQAEWAEDHGYDDPAVSSPSLRAWFMAMIERFPAMNGPHASDDVDDPKLTDYCVGTVVVYAAFALTEAKSARMAAFSVSKQHGVGFFDVSSDDAGVWMPTTNGEYRLRHSE